MGRWFRPLTQRVGRTIHGTGGDDTNNEINFGATETPSDPSVGDFGPQLESFDATGFVACRPATQPTSVSQPTSDRSGAFVTPQFRGIETNLRFTDQRTHTIDLGAQRDQRHGVGGHHTRPHGINHTNQLLEQHLERTRTRPTTTDRTNITLQASDIGRSTINSDIGSSDIGSHSFGSGSIDARAKPAGGFFGWGFSGGSVIEHVFDIRNRV